MAAPDGDIIRTLRHDLSNPLAAILAEAQLLLLDEATLDAETVEGLREIESLARRMRDMLAATRAAG
jgi:signal transduction histidine kinase